MKYDTAGNQIYEPLFNCDCGLTGGCEKCNMSDFISQSARDVLKEIEPISKEDYDYYDNL